MSNQNPDEPIRFYFTIAPLQSALTRSHDGGCRIKLDVDQTGVTEINRMFDLAVQQGGVVFAAVVLPLDSTADATPETE